MPAQESGHGYLGRETTLTTLQSRSLFPATIWTNVEYSSSAAVVCRTEHVLDGQIQSATDSHLSLVRDIRGFSPWLPGGMLYEWPRVENFDYAINPMEPEKPAEGFWGHTPHLVRHPSRG